MDEAAFNPDELAAQLAAGGGPRGSAIRSVMPEQHRRFFAQLPYLFVGAIDGGGWPLATLLAGTPGFVQSPDAVTLRISALPEIGDPAGEALVPNREIGILGIDFSTRRRNRANGRVLTRDGDGFSVAVQQSFGNCPQYIQLRILQSAPLECAAAGEAYPAECFDRLDAAARAAVAQADTFFVASHSRVGAGAAYGADVSHRGGRPGFVRVEGDVLTIPDFRGNRYFNTLGNLHAEPRASLLFVDFTSGELLQLQGLAEIDWNVAAAERFAGAERLWHFRVTRGWRRSMGWRLRWTFVEYSRATAQTGSWRAGGRPA